MKDVLNEIKMVPIRRLKLWKGNPRANEEAVPKLAELIKKHGIRSPLVVWKKNNVIYKGNTTYKAAKKLGIKLLPVAWASFPSEAAAQAYGIADNKSSEFAEWDEDVLSKIMDNKTFASYQKFTGFTDKELDGVLFRPNLEKIDNIDETAEGILSKITIICKPNMKEKIARTINRVLNKKYPDKFVIK